MTFPTDKYASMTKNQLIELIKDSEDQEIRIWVEKKTEDGGMMLEGRRLIGVMDDPNDKYICLVAGYYRNEEEE